MELRDVLPRKPVAETRSNTATRSRSSRQAGGVMGWGLSQTSGSSRRTPGPLTTGFVVAEGIPQCTTRRHGRTYGVPLLAGDDGS